MSSSAKIFLGIAAVAAVLFSLFVKLELLAEARQAKFAFKDGEVVPDFTLMDLDEQPQSLHAAVAQHDLVVINFWGTWCAPCRLELPEFIRAYDQFGDGQHLQLLAITSEPREDVDLFVADSPIPFPVLLDADSKLTQQLGVSVYPTTVVLDTDGKVLEVQAGIYNGFHYWIADRLGIEARRE